MQALKPFLLRLRFLFIPPGSQREGWYYVFRHILLQRRLGWKAFLRKTFQAVYIRLHAFLKHRELSPEEFQYQVWIREHEPARSTSAKGDFEEEDVIHRKYSFLLFKGASEFHYIEKTIQSILLQTYPYWELWILSPENLQFPNLEQFTRGDSRIKIVIAASKDDSIFEIQQLEGDFFLILHSGDTVSPYLLQEVNAQLQTNPLLDMLYFDEDHYDVQSGYRFSPWFKPSHWSQDLLISANYLRHAVIRKTALEFGKLPFSLDEFREWEMTLRITEQLRQIKHIPKVLYHQVQTEQIDRPVEFPESAQWISKAIEEHLSRKGIENPKVSLRENVNVHVFYPTNNVLASIIIPNKNRLSYIKPCITSLLEKTRYPNFEILLVDNQSDDPAVHAYYESLINEPRINVLSYPHPFNFHALNNWAVRKTKGEVLIFLNNDTEVLEPDWLEEMVGCAMRPDVGIVGAKLLRPNGKIQHAGMIIGLMGHAADIFEDCEDHSCTCFGCVDWYRNYHAVTGACMAIRREVFVRLGGFDEIYEVGYGDIDLCLRAHEQGYRIVYNPFVVLKHHEGGTRKFWLPPSDVLRATIKMWSAVEGGDGYFNPNLSYQSRTPTLATQEESRPTRLLRILQEFALVEGGASMLPPDISMPHDA